MKRVLRWADIACSTYFHKRREAPKKPGRKSRSLDEALVAKVVEYAEKYPWWGYKRLAVVMRNADVAVSNAFVRKVFRLKKLFQSRKKAEAERIHGPLDKLAAFRERYNTVRPHWALRPVDVYAHGREVELPKWQGWARAARRKLEARMREEGVELDALVAA